MFFNPKVFSVYRRTLNEGNLGYSWVLIGTIKGTLCPISISDAIRNEQDFSDVKNFISMKIYYKDIVQEQDEIVDVKLNTRYHVRSVKVLDNVLPHIELYLGKTQWQ